MRLQEVGIAPLMLHWFKAPITLLRTSLLVLLAIVAVAIS